MRATAPAPTTATKYFSKNIPKGIGKSVSSHTATHATHPGGIGVYSCMSKTIIGSTLFIIIEDLISLFDLFKTVFGFFVVRVTVGVVFHCQTTIRTTYIVLACTFFQT